MSDTFPPFEVAGPLDLGGISLARTISRLGVVSGAPGTFLWDESTGLSEAWNAWLDAWFTPVLAPALVSVHHFASEMRPDEIVATDLAVDRALPEPLRRRSLSAAKPFLTGKDEMRAHRAWSRVSARVAAGESPGHLVTLFALQTALYHLPLAPALGAYAWFELESGLPPAHRDRPGTASEALALFAAALPQVRLAMGADRDEFSGEAPRLRAL
jgi:urease accessory protein UreF